MMFCKNFQLYVYPVCRIIALMGYIIPFIFVSGMSTLAEAHRTVVWLREPELPLFWAIDRPSKDEAIKASTGRTGML